jgi:hypothetical protein
MKLKKIFRISGTADTNNESSKNTSVKSEINNDKEIFSLFTAYHFSSFNWFHLHSAAWDTTGTQLIRLKTNRGTNTQTLESLVHNTKQVLYLKTELGTQLIHYLFLKSDRGTQLAHASVELRQFHRGNCWMQ